MKKILILSDKPSVDQGLFDWDKFKQLIEASQKVEVYLTYFEDLVYILNGNQVRVIDGTTNVDISNYDLVYRKRSDYIQQHPLSCAMYLKYKRVPFIDSEFQSVMNPNAHKLVEHMLYAVHSLPFPGTIIATKQNIHLVRNYLTGDFPKVLKSLTATRGDYNFLVNSFDEAQKIIEEADMENTEFALQEYIPNDSDFRFLVLGYKTKLIIQRKRRVDSTSHTNNTSKGASAELIDVSTLQDEVKTLAERAAKVFSREIAGVDIMIGSEDNKAYVLEVNRSPQIENGAFVQDKSNVLAEFLAGYSNTDS
jgi:glutathione synthase/RimK-type ligase-like ATP-grasp enzyme